MFANLRSWLPAKPSTYQRRAPLVLVNGLAEQAESWYRNVAAWRRHFDVHTPNILAYEGAALHRHIDDGGVVDVDYLVQRLHDYLDNFVQTPPYHIVANSLGGKIAVEYAVRYPEQVARIVLLCPSGLSDEERLPVVEGVRRNDLKSLVDSVFSDTRHADPVMLAYYQQKFTNRRWRSGLMRTIRGTMHHRVADSLPRVTQKALVVVGDADRIVDATQTRQMAERLPQGRVIVLKNCGHAPQIERAATVNRLVIDFMRVNEPVGDADR